MCIRDRYLYTSKRSPSDHYFYDGKDCFDMFRFLLKMNNDPILQEYMTKAEQSLTGSLEDTWNSMGTSVNRFS